MSDEHVMQMPPTELAIIPEDQRLEASPYKDILPQDVELYRNHIVHYFDNQLNHDILVLPSQDKERLFEMLDQYADILEKIFHPGIPILEYILGKPGAAAAAKPHAGINFDYDCQIIAEYKVWKDVQKAKQALQVPIQTGEETN
jgi:hypothetical protein